MKHAIGFYNKPNSAITLFDLMKSWGWKNSIETNEMSDRGLTIIPILELSVSSKEEEVSSAGLTQLILQFYSTGSMLVHQ